MGFLERCSSLGGDFLPGSSRRFASPGTTLGWGRRSASAGGRSGLRGSRRAAGGGSSGLPGLSARAAGGSGWFS
jgi:hypothetical protein